MRYSKKIYFFVKFERSKKPTKKYDALIKHNLTKKIVRISFGARGYEQFYDSALGLYKIFDHGEKKRKKKYRARHKGYLRPGYYTPAYFSWEFLWT